MSPTLDPALLPRNQATDEPLQPSAQPGYYPGYRTLSQKAFWDETTRKLVLARVGSLPPIRHFKADEVSFWRAVFDHLIPQFDRALEYRIPIVELIDDRLYHNKTGGYRYESMPPDREAYRLGGQAIDEEAEKRFGRAFLLISVHQQDLVLKAIHDGAPTAGEAVWQQMSIGRFWQMLMQDAIESYYAHPWAWDEIGFGGPAYPRAYTRLERGEPEPWEVEEKRYQWQAPTYTVSDVTESTVHLYLEADQIG